eukprot:TRINITY_DN2719_c0_g1_i1.p1 TRINITY_DN2719_c0_g1~~TRINITY_DN2719_c0_g1_i1.p1  ORF type:complete len:116 (-),score=15.55 TRINITY_DN2719_c0_g1_i1:306-653(-)
MHSIATGIANGMSALAKQFIVHRDLAARNVLLTKERVPKIADFGYSRVLSEETKMGKTQTYFGPIKWMAPESIRELVYSEASDVWRYGINLFSEIVLRPIGFSNYFHKQLWHCTI